MKNLIINGACQVAQRSSGPLLVKDGAIQTIDRFKFFNKTKARVTSAQIFDGPLGLDHCLDIKVVTAEKLLAKNSFFLVQYLIDVSEISDLKIGENGAEVFNFSFYVKSNKTGAYILNLAALIEERIEWTSYYEIKKKDEWTRIKFKVEPNTLSKNLKIPLNQYDGTRFIVSFTLTGDDEEIKYPLGEWVRGLNHFQGHNQVKFLEADNNYWRLTGLQLEIGERATPFESLPYDAAIQECWRHIKLPKLEELVSERLEILAVKKNRANNLEYFDWKDLFSLSFWNTAIHIAKTTIGMQYKNTFLGLIWLFLPSIATMLVYVAIMPLITKTDPKTYALYLLSTLPIWQFLVGVMVTNSQSLIANIEIIKRTTGSPLLFPSADYLKSLYTFIVSLIAMIIVGIAAGLKISIESFWLIPYLIPIIIVSYLISISLSFLTPFINDLKEFISVSMSILMWGSAIVYPINILPTRVQEYISYNPFYILIEPSIYILNKSSLPPTYVNVKLLVLVLLTFLVSTFILRQTKRDYIYYL